MLLRRSGGDRILHRKLIIGSFVEGNMPLMKVKQFSRPLATCSGGLLKKRSV
jgi:hypothetical protein